MVELQENSNIFLRKVFNEEQEDLFLFRREEFIFLNLVGSNHI